MRTLAKLALVAAVVLSTTVVSYAQGQGRQRGQGQGQGQGRQGGGFGGMMGGNTPSSLITNKSVIEELKLTDEQKETSKKWAEEAGKKLQEKRAEAFPNQGGGPGGGGGGGGGQQDPAAQAKRAEFNATVEAEQLKELEKVLKEDQGKRLKQLIIQIQSVRAFSRKDVIEGLKITDEQKEAFKEIGGAMQTETRELFQELNGNFAEMPKKMAELNKKFMDKMKAQLKDDQKKTWGEMVGKDFEYKAEAPMRRRDN